MNEYLDEFRHLNIFAIDKGSQGGRSNSKDWEVLFKKTLFKWYMSSLHEN